MNGLSPASFEINTDSMHLSRRQFAMLWIRSQLPIAFRLESN